MSDSLLSESRGAYHLHKPRGGNSVHKHKTMEFDVVGGRSTTNYIQITFDSEDDYRTGCRNISHCQQQQCYSGLIVHPDDETQPTFISKSVEQTKKSRKKLHHHKTQPIFSEASQTKCRKPFDFPTRISSFPK